MSESKPMSGAGTVGVYMRLKPEVVARLDELASSTSGSRGAVVTELVGQAEVREVTATVTVKRLTLASEAREAREAAADE